jgi:hypothetical protein
MAGPVEVTQFKVNPKKFYRPSSITLYGIELAAVECFIGLSDLKVGIGLAATPVGSPPKPLWEPALIYGYSYQGHVYNLPEPVIILVNKNSGKLADEAGYYNGPPYIPPYMQWEADKLEKTAQLMVTNDTFEELILKKNIGETRQPMSYHAAMVISHRGGKLMD